MSDRFLAVLTPLTVPDGLVFVYRRTGDEGSPWMLEQEIAIDCAFPAMLQGSRLALDGNTLVVGVPQDSQLGFLAGAAYVFQREGNVAVPWRLVQVLFAPDGKHGDTFGYGLDLEGDRLVVGAPAESSVAIESGAVYYFERMSTAGSLWQFHQKLAPISLGNNVNFGGILDLDGSTLAVGAPRSNAGVLEGGAVYIFEAEAGRWVEEVVLTPPDVAFQDDFGGGLALSSDWLIASSPSDDDAGAGSGAAHVFQRQDGRWNYHQKVLPELGAALEFFGGYLAVEGDTFFVGNPLVDEVGLDAGTVYAFKFDDSAGQWIQANRFFPLDLDDHDHLGPVAVSGGIVAAGASKSQEPGAVYVYSSRPGQEVTNYCRPTSGTMPECAPTLETLGTPSASQSSTFKLWSRFVPGAGFGMLLYSKGRGALPDLGSSGLCIPTSNLHRKGLFLAGGTFGLCDGTFELNWNEFIDDRDPESSLLRTPGANVHVQVAWFDPLTLGAPAWSDALSFQLCP